MSDFFDGIDDVVDGRKWEYEEGDQLGGKVVKVFRGEGDYGPYSGYVIEAVAGSTESGNAVEQGDLIIYYVNDNSAAARDLAPGRVKPDDVLKVKFFGERESKAGRTFKKFNHILVPTASAGETADW